MSMVELLEGAVFDKFPRILLDKLRCPKFSNLDASQFGQLYTLLCFLKYIITFTIPRFFALILLLRHSLPAHCLLLRPVAACPSVPFDWAISSRNCAGQA